MAVHVVYISAPFSALRVEWLRVVKQHTRTHKKTYTFSLLLCVINPFLRLLHLLSVTHVFASAALPV